MATGSITEFGSEGASIQRIATSDEISVVRIALRAGGRLAMHPASRPQLFIVVEGAGTVCGDEGDAQTVSAGTSVWWQQGEFHETNTELGLVAIVIEANSLDV
jgi:quercetin dioxygenase-like cupin family protein